MINIFFTLFRWLFMLIVLIILPTTFSTIYIPTSEYLALHALYQSTSGNYWKWKTPYSNYGYPWNFNSSELASNPCNTTSPWQGITCSPSCTSLSCHIVSISLYSYNLTGYLPQEIGNLTQLTSLNLPNNLIIGTIPQPIEQLTKLLVLNLNGNRLQGSLTHINFTLLHDLQGLFLEVNLLNGSMPQSIYTLTQLSTLRLSYNQFTGSISSDIKQLTQLTELYLPGNLLTGTIPVEISLLVELTYIFLSSNQLTGVIPSNISSLTQLQYCLLDNNYLSQTIPSSLGQLTMLITLDIDNNRLTGSLSTNFFDQLLNLQYLLCYDNYFTGHIPSTISLASNLLEIVFETNQFSGNLPESIGQLTNLQDFIVYTNYFTGSLPSSINNCTDLGLFDMFDNYFTSSIPSSYGFIPYIEAMDLSTNLLTGTIPNTFQQNYLYFFSVRGNYLQGSFPLSLWSKDALFYLDLSYNQFSSTLPSNITLHSTILMYFDISHNQFTGSISSTCFFQQLTVIKYLNLGNNFFTGSLPLTIPSIHLEILYLQNNSFVGSIPWTLFNSTKVLSTLVLSLNCLTGTIPTSICQNTLLTQVIMDGLHSSLHCIHHIFPFYIGTNQAAYFANQQVHGTIPTCLLTLPNLQILHLSGNSLTGSLPSVITSNQQQQQSKNLTTVILANNLLTGNIPSYLLTNYLQIFYLDLSFNLFTGFSFQENTNITSSTSNLINTWNQQSSLYDNASISIQPNLHLQINHLSGHLSPYWWSNWTDLTINILSGNMFTCDLNRHDLPSKDPNYLSYQCDSYNTNVVVYLTLSFLFFLISLYFFFSFFCFQSIMMKQIHYLQTTLQHVFASNKQALQHFQTQMTLISEKKSALTPSSEGPSLDISLESSQEPSLNTHKTSFSNAQDMLTISILFLNWLPMLFTWLFLILLPCYILFSYYYGTYSHQYIWIVSIAYIQGLIPGICIFCLFLFPIICFNYYCLQCNDQVFQQINHYMFIFPYQSTWKTIQSIQYITWKQWKRFFGICGFIFLDVLIVMLVNIGYITAINANYSNNILQLISLSLGIFKFCWNHWYLLGSLRQSYEQTMQGTIPIHVLLFLSIFNHVLAPYIAETFTSANCFLYLITNSPTIQTFYAIIQCNPQYTCTLNNGIYKQCSFSLYCEELNTYLPTPWSSSTGNTRLPQDTSSITTLFPMGSLINTNLFTTFMNSFFYITGYLFNLSQTIMFTWASFLISSMTDNNTSTNQQSENTLQSYDSISYIPPFHYNYTCSSSLLSAFIYVFMYRYLVSLCIEPLIVLIIKYCQINYEQTYKNLHIQWMTKNQISSSIVWLQWLTSRLPLLLQYEEIQLTSCDSLVPMKSIVSLAHNPMNSEEINNQTTTTSIKLTQSNEDNSIIQENENNISQIQPSNDIEHSQPPIITTSSSTLHPLIQSNQLLLNEIQQQTLSKIFNQYQTTSSSSTSTSLSMVEIFFIQFITDLTMFFSFGLLFPLFGGLILLTMIKNIYWEQYFFSRIYSCLFSLFTSYSSNSSLSNKELIGLFYEWILSCYHTSSNRMKPMVWYGIWWSLLVSGLFWSFVLYDILGSSSRIITWALVGLLLTSSLWTMLVMIVMIRGLNSIILPWIPPNNNMHNNMNNTTNNCDNNENNFDCEEIISSNENKKHSIQLSSYQFSE